MDVNNFPGVDMQPRPESNPSDTVRVVPQLK